MDVEEEVKRNFSLTSAESVWRACRACFAEPARECLSTEVDAAPPELLTLAALDSEGRVRLCARCARDLRAGRAFRRRCLQSEALLRAARVKPEPEDDPRALVETELEEDVKHPRNEAAAVESAADRTQSGAAADDDVKRYACRLCPMVATTARGLSTHARWHARPARNPHACHRCPETFKRKRELEGHAKRAHAEAPRRNQCDECGKTFTRPTHLRRHAIVHTGEKPHSCGVCGKAFGNADARDHHVAAIHAGGRPFECDACGKRFACKPYLRQHVATHADVKPFACGACAARFALKKYLYYHARTHTGETYAACARCGRRFARGDSMDAHLRAHARGEVRDAAVTHNFVCDACGAGFTYRASIVKHVRDACAKCDETVGTSAARKCTQ